MNGGRPDVIHVRFLVMLVVSPPIVVTSNVVTPNAEKTNDGFQTVGKTKKRKGKSKSTNGGQFTGPSVKQNVRYEPKATTSAPKKGTTYVGYTYQSTPILKTTSNSSKKDNLSMSNSFSALNEEEEDEEDMENIHLSWDRGEQFPKTYSGSRAKTPCKKWIKEEDALPLDIDFHIQKIASSSTGNNLVLGLRAPKAEDGCCGSGRKKRF
ncbi:hypothetical protein Tco_1380902 [Tanacetum coccineum]